MKIRKVVIPVAGKGTRMLPVTKTIPKEMISLLNKPLLQYVVEEALQAKIEQIIFVTSNGKEDIQKYFSRNVELEVFLEKNNKLEELELVKQIGNMAEIITVNQKEQLGLGHAILQVESIVKDERFAVILPDDLIIGDTSAIAELETISDQNNQASTIGIISVPREQTNRYGIVHGPFLPNSSRTLKIIEMIEKPHPDKAPSTYAAPGRYILNAEIFELLRQIGRGAGGEYQLTDAIALLATKRTTLAHLISGARFDVGCLSGYLEAMLTLGMRDPIVRPDLVRIIKSLVL